MKKILVTGAGGYIGSVLVPKLLSQAYEVFAVDRFFFGQDKLASHPKLHKILGDTRSLPESLFSGVEAVIDLVAISNDPSGDAFSEATWQINYASRVRTAKLAKAQGVKRYILPSSCSIYGFQTEKVDETASTNPLTVYARANEQAEKEILPLASEDFVVVVLRQATVFGASPRMRFDLAINAMTYGAWKNHTLPLMRDGQQYRPMVHVQDTSDLMIFLLTAEAQKINGQIFNVGGETQNYQLGDLGQKIASTVSKRISQEVPIEWYGEGDPRSYQVSFEKVKTVLGWSPQWTAEMGVSEILEQLMSGKLTKSPETITLDCYRDQQARGNDVNETLITG